MKTPLSFVGRPETGAPPQDMLVTGTADGRGPGYYALRPRGTKDHLLTYTLAGLARFGHRGGELIARPGTVVLIRPGTPHDYGTEPRLAHWKNVWAHFTAGPDMTPWLRLPEVAPGLMCLPLKPPIRQRVHREMLAMHRFATTGSGSGQALAINALERVLLYCFEAAGQDKQPKDPRVRRAVTYIFDHLAERLSLDRLASETGCSRSAFAAIFTRAMRISPAAFIEAQRLDRVYRLLERTDLTLEQLAPQTGFSSPFYLSLRFKKRFGASPREYRRRFAKAAP